MGDEAVRYLTAQEVARILAVSTNTLRNWRQYGSGPRYVKIGDRLVRYRFDEVVAWAEHRGLDVSRGG
jgi:excisionase family DNA binding protein